MKLSFETQPEDIQRYARVHSRSPHSKRLRSTAALLFFSLGSMFGLLLLTFTQRFVPALGALVLGIASAVIVWLRWNRAVIARIVRLSEAASGAGLIGPKTVELREDGLGWSTAVRSSVLPWRSVERLVAEEGVLAIYVTPSFALIVPDRVFADAAARDQFKAALEQRTQKRFEAFTGTSATSPGSPGPAS